MRQVLPILLILLLALPVLIPAESQARLPTKIIVRVHVTKLWLAENADTDPPGSDPDLWLFTLVGQVGLGKSVRSFGERSIDPKEYDKDQNNVYDPKKDETLNPLELMGGKGVQDTVIYSSEQCKPIRPFSIYFRMIDSDKSGSDKPSFFDKVSDKLSGYLKKSLAKGVGFIFNGMFSVLKELFKNDFDLVGVGQKLSWLPAKRFEVLRGSSSGDWNTEKEGKAWKDGELPPPGKTWVSEETRVELRAGGKLGAIVWFRLEVYNTGESCATVKPKVKKEVEESKAAVESVEVTKGLEASKIRFKVTLENPIKDTDGNLSVVIEGKNYTQIYRIIISKGLLTWEGEGLKLLDAGEKFVLWEFEVGTGDANISFISQEGGRVVSSASLSARFPRPSIILVSNEVDRVGFDPLICGLRSEGLEFSIREPPLSLEELRGMASSTPVVIAGGPDAYGVGELVRKLLPEDMEDMMRKEPKVAKVEWLAEKPVYVIAGPDRYATRRALSSAVSLVVEEAAKNDKEPPFVVLGPEVFMSVNQETDINRSEFLLSESAELRDFNLTYLAFGREVLLPGSRVIVEGRWIRLDLPEYRPENLILRGILVDRRGNEARVSLRFGSGSPVPFLVMRKVMEERISSLSKEFTLEAANLGGVHMMLRYAGTQQAPPFIKVEVVPESYLIEPNLSIPVYMRVTVNEGAPEGTYSFTVLFENVQAGIYLPLEVVVEVS